MFFKDMKKRTEKILVSSFLALFIFLASISMINNSATFDEPNIITAGYSYWKTGDYRLTFEHPPLAKLIAGFPLLFMNPEPVLPLESEEWKVSEMPEGAFVQQWQFSQNFFFKMSNDAETMFLYARIPFLLLGVLLGIFVYSFTKKILLKQQMTENNAMYGALFSLFLYTFSPLMLAYTTLAITDGAITAFFFITLYYAWQWTETQRTKDLLLCGIFFGLSNATKFTGLYLIPTTLILFLADIFVNNRENKENKEKKKEWWRAAKAFIIILAFGIFIVSASYGFTNSASYLDGFTFVREHSTVGHNAYLLGEYSVEGWWYYFIVAFFTKTPIALIILFTLALFFIGKEKKILSKETLFLLIPPALYFIAFMLNNINIGIRHILPVYPFLFVFTATEGTAQIAKTKSKWIIAAAALCILWSIVTIVLVAPHYIAYFNEVVGGSNNGAKILLDSNIDWSQDIERLENWLDKNELKEEPQYYALFTLEPLAYRNMTTKSMPCSPHVGLFIISANELYDLGQRYQGCLKWLQNEEPAEKIGYSIFIYNITEKTHPEIAAIGNQCTATCMTICAEANQVYVDYVYTDHCVCACEE